MSNGFATLPRKNSHKPLAFLRCILYNHFRTCRCDGIGRRSGLKIHRWRHRAGSSPATGTNRNRTPLAGVLFLLVPMVYGGSRTAEYLSRQRQIFAVFAKAGARMEEENRFRINHGSESGDYPQDTPCGCPVSVSTDGLWKLSIGGISVANATDIRWFLRKRALEWKKKTDFA